MDVALRLPATAIEAARVMLLEDDTTLGETVCMVLDAMGLQNVCHVSSLADASAALTPPAFDLCIIDIWIHGKSSHEVAEAAAKSGAALLLVSGSEPPATFDDLLPGCPFLKKPATLADWQSAIERAFKAPS